MSDLVEDINNLLKYHKRGERISLEPILQLMKVMAEIIDETYLKVQDIEVYGVTKNDD